MEAAVAGAFFAHISISCWSGNQGFFAVVQGGMFNGAVRSLTPVVDFRYRMLWLLYISDVAQQLLEGWERAVILLIAGRERRFN